jgi:uncharacterized membrane protein
LSDDPKPPNPSVPADVVQREDNSKPSSVYNQQVNFNFNLGQVLPDPDKLDKYPPALVEAMIVMAQKEQGFRHTYQFSEQKNKMFFERRAQFCTLISYLVIFSIGGLCVLKGHAGFGGTLITAAFLTAIGSSFFNRPDGETGIEEEPPVDSPPDSKASKN